MNVDNHEFFPVVVLYLNHHIYIHTIYTIHSGQWEAIYPITILNNFFNIMLNGNSFEIHRSYRSTIHIFFKANNFFHRYTGYETEVKHNFRILKCFNNVSKVT